MGRGDLSRTLLIVVAAAAAVASAAAAAVGVSWTLLQTGRAVPVGSEPVGYVAVTQAQEARFARRLTVSGRASLARVNLQRTGVVAVFLDGMPCGRDVTVSHVVRNASTLTVAVSWTRPPIGMAMCVRTATPYVVIGVKRSLLGHPAAAHVKVVAVARS